MKAAAKPKHKPKPKLRLARQADRDHAAEIARIYREQFPCMVSRGADGSIAWSPMTGSDLAAHLESFAKHGTFHPPSESRAQRDAFLRLRYAALRPTVASYEIAVEMLAEEMDCSETTVRTAVKPSNTA